jgi:hypothetical protein
MTSDQSNFADLMADAHRCVIALDALMARDGAKAAAQAVRDGESVYARLLEYQKTVRMTVVESALLQTALDLLRARLRFFGEAV